jgi:hypothetical protein
MPLLRRYFTTGLIALLSLVALLAIYVLITGELGWSEIKALLTALIGFAAGLNAITCLTCRHEVPKPWLAWCGVGLGILSACLLLALLWLNIQAPHYWQVTGVTLVWTLVYTHCLLPSLIQLEGWKQLILVPLTRACSLLLGGVLSYSIISGVYTGWLIRTFSVLCILVGFFTLLLVILHRRTKSLTQRLILTQSADGLFMDASGRYYQVTPVE